MDFGHDLTKYVADNFPTTRENKAGKAARFQPLLNKALAGVAIRWSVEGTESCLPKVHYLHYMVT
jgi:hypothetical protein